MHMKFIYSPAGIWNTTWSRSSRQGYFQISFPCKHCKWTKHHFFVYYFIIDRESWTHSRNERANSRGLPPACNKMLQKIKEQSNLEAKLGALKEMISEGWLTHVQQHPTLLKPNWSFRDQIAGEDGIFTKVHRIIIPTTLQKHISLNSTDHTK